MPGRETGTLNCSCDLRFEEFRSVADREVVGAWAADLLFKQPLTLSPDAQSGFIPGNPDGQG